MTTCSVHEGPNHMTSTWKKYFFSFCVFLPVFFFLFCYLHFLVLFLLFWFISIFSIRLLLSAFFYPHFSIRIRHPHLPSAGIRSSFYRRPNRIIHWKTIQFRFTGSFHIKKKNYRKKKLYAYLSRLNTFLKIFSFIKATSNLIRWASL